MIKLYSITYLVVLLLSLNTRFSHCNEQLPLPCEDYQPSPTLSLVAIILGLILVVVTLVVMGICVLNLIVMIRNKVKGKELVFI